MFDSIKAFPRQLTFGEKGFTLIEILVIIAILGLLAGIVIPNVVRFMNEGDDEARNTERDNFQAAVISLMFDNDSDELVTVYDDVQEEADILLVRAKLDDGNPSTGSLRDYLMGGKYPLKQSYDIATNGVVTINE